MHRTWSKYVIWALLVEALHLVESDRIIYSDLQDLFTAVPSVKIYALPPMVGIQCYDLRGLPSLPAELLVAVGEKDVAALTVDYASFSQDERETLIKIFSSRNFRNSILLFLGFLHEMLLVYPELQHSCTAIPLQWFNKRCKERISYVLSQTEVDSILFMTGGKFNNLPKPFIEFVHTYVISHGIYARIDNWSNLVIKQLAYSWHEVNFTCLTYILSEQQIEELLAEIKRRTDTSVNTATTYDMFLVKLIMFAPLTEPSMQKVCSIILRTGIRDSVAPTFISICKGPNAVLFKQILDDNSNA